MRMNWGNPASFPYERGKLYVGKSLDHKTEVGLTTDRHALTSAGPRTGKGVGVIIPNLLRWPENALVIDPKGEAAEATAEHREKEFGQEIHILDPFNKCDVPDRYKAQFNPLDEIDPNALTAREDILTIVDGLIMKDDPRAGFWDGGGETIMAGMMAQIVSRSDKRNLMEMRKLIDLKGDDFNDLIYDQLANNHACGELPIEAFSKLTKSGDQVGSFMGVADENTKWLNSPAMASIMSDSTFKLSDLKHKKCTVYLVLPAEYLAVHNRFLRLFVRCAIDAMAKGGHKNKTRCLFLLDEFFSLGYIDTIAKAAGLMPGYGVHLWPILQDLGQLYKLYGKEGAQSFIGGADLLQFFGMSDEITPEFVSKRLGVIRENEVQAPPEKQEEGAFESIMYGLMDEVFSPDDKNKINTTQSRLAHREVQYTNAINEWQKEARIIGTPRVNIDEVMNMTQKKDKGINKGKIAEAQICFIKNQPFYLRLCAHFTNYIPADPPPPDTRTGWQKFKDFWV